MLTRFEIARRNLKNQCEMPDISAKMRNNFGAHEGHNFVCIAMQMDVYGKLWVVTVNNGSLVFNVSMHISQTRCWDIQLRSMNDNMVVLLVYLNLIDRHQYLPPSCIFRLIIQNFS